MEDGVSVGLCNDNNADTGTEGDGNGAKDDYHHNSTTYSQHL